ncbi:MAG: hypothetical protein ACTS46_02010 [Candidatus Hodgkinia cicadicola]
MNESYLSPSKDATAKVVPPSKEVARGIGLNLNNPNEWKRETDFVPSKWIERIALLSFK